METRTFALVCALVAFAFWVAWRLERVPQALEAAIDDAILVVVPHDGPTVSDTVSQLFTRAVHPQRVNVLTSVRAEVPPAPRDRIAVATHTEFAGAGPMRGALLQHTTVDPRQYRFVMLIDGHLQPANAWDRRCIEALARLPTGAVLTAPANSTQPEYCKITRVSSRGIHTTSAPLGTGDRCEAAVFAQQKCCFGPSALVECIGTAPSKTTADTVFTWRLWAAAMRPFHPHFPLAFPEHGRVPATALHTWAEPHGLDTPGAAAYVRDVGVHADGTIDPSAQRGLLDPYNDGEARLKEARVKHIPFPPVVKVNRGTTC